MGFWRVPPMWAGQTVAILAGGPSMSQAVADQVRDSGVAAVAINNAFRLAPWAAMLYAADEEWWRHPDNRDAHAFAGLKVSVGQIQGVHRLRNSGTTGFDKELDAVRTGGNSGYQAVHIAAHAGAAQILLCGFDMHEEGGSHWHGDHPAPLRKTPTPTFDSWCGRFADLAKVLEARGVDVVNCTPGSALKCFRFATLGDSLTQREVDTAVR